jgi:methyl-accepting chemotaxis protein
MKKYSLYTVVFVMFIILIIGNFGSVYLSVNKYEDDLIEKTIDEKINLASIINQIVSSDIWFYRKTLYLGVEEVFIEKMARSKDVRYIRIVKVDGSIQQSSIEEERWGIIEDEDITRSIINKKVIVRDEVFRGEKIKTIIYPCYYDATIWVAFSLESVEKIIRDMSLYIIFTALGTLSFVVLFMVLILRNIIVDPLKRMTLICKEIGKGNLNVKVDTKSKTEIGELANTFNKMIDDLKKSKIELEESKNVLEIKVAARTRELKELNMSLEERVKERTKQLQNRIDELERLHKLIVGRELKMAELKKEIEKFKKNGNGDGLKS